jgi:carbon-monoxide dehydrogenase medium subunit
MKPAPFDYHAPHSVEEAIELLARLGPDARPLAGGQSLVPMLALRLARPSALIDLNRIASLTGIKGHDGSLRLGAMTRQASILRSKDVAAKAGLLAQALGHVGHPPTRARGTVGGSLSHADPAAELPAAMVALDAEFTLRSAQGERTIAASDFFHGMFETAIGPGELLTEIRVPVAAGRASGFVEIAHRQGDFAIISAAVVLDLDEHGSCSQVRVVLGGAGPVPLRCPEVEAALVNAKPDPRALARAAAAVAVAPIEFDSPSASRAYRRKVAPVLIRRALDAACAGAGVRQ